MSSKPEHIKVVFIGGYTRSGSTLLDLVLGQIDGFFSVGEFQLVWERGLYENQLCGCGKKFWGCSFWNAVCEEALGSIGTIDREALRTLHRRVDRIRYIPLILTSSLRSSAYAADLEEYSRLLSRFYSAIKTVSGCDFIIDSSKNPSHGFLLNTLPEIDLYLTHLVRDSRAVAYSWQRRKRRPEIHWKQQCMPVYRELHSALGWVQHNLLIEIMKATCHRSKLVRYEDFAANPKATVNELVGELYRHKPGKSNCDLHKIYLGANHTVSGNPLRFKQGEIKIELDNEWKGRIRSSQYGMITALSLPLLWAYGYRIL